MKKQNDAILGNLLPDSIIKEKSIYELLSKTHWTLIVCGKEKIRFQMPHLKIMHAPEGAYSSRYILIKPDWHVALADNKIDEQSLTQTLVQN